MTTADRAETRISGHSAHSRQGVPEGRLVPWGASQRGHRGGGGGRRRVLQRAQTRPALSSRGIQLRQPRQLRGRKRSRRSAPRPADLKVPKGPGPILS